jgi:hypothetical protein
VAQVGIVPIALAAYGALVSIREAVMRWWTAVLVLSLAFVAASPWILGSWNPRYGLFFMLPVWVLAAAGTAAIAEALRSWHHGVAWLGVVAILSAPKFASHFVDGSRHDFRTAADVVLSRAPNAQVVSNWPATLQYYLEPQTGQRPTYWSPGDPLPREESLIVLASNTWEPVLRVQNRTVRVIGEVGRRRFDEQSHLIRIYVVGPTP